MSSLQQSHLEWVPRFDNFDGVAIIWQLWWCGDHCAIFSFLRAVRISVPMLRSVPVLKFYWSLLMPLISAMRRVLLVGWCCRWPFCSYLPPPRPRPFASVTLSQIGDLVLPSLHAPRRKMRTKWIVALPLTNRRCLTLKLSREVWETNANARNLMHLVFSKS